MLRIAECQAALGRLVESTESYRAVVRTPLPAGAPPAFQAAVDQAKAELTQVEPRVPKVERTSGARRSLGRAVADRRTKRPRGTHRGSHRAEPGNAQDHRLRIGVHELGADRRSRRTRVEDRRFRAQTDRERRLRAKPHDCRDRPHCHPSTVRVPSARHSRQSASPTASSSRAGSAPADGSTLTHWG